MGPVGPLLLINGPHAIIVLYWAPDGSCYIVYPTSCILGRAPCTKETMSDFCSIMSPGKGDTIVWYQVT